jgi:hypothetical protein
MQQVSAHSTIQRMAKAGYAAKGIVYFLLGVLAFMAAFELGRSASEASRGNVFRMVRDAPAGGVLMGVLALGLVCYALWRMVQAFAPKYGHENKGKKRVMYFFSGLAYAGVAFAAIKMALWHQESGGNQQQELAANLLARKGGQWLTGLVALLLLGTGIYQIYYGWSEKYRKHVQESNIPSQHAHLLLRSGKIGYIARGLVWVVISFLLFRAALHARAAEAGDTADAFRFLEASPFGSYLLGAVGLGLVAFGIFSWVRAAYERF